MRIVAGIALSSLLLGPLCSSVTADPEAKITVLVADEDGTPVANASVHAGFIENAKPGWGWGGAAEEHWESHTDTNGVCVIRKRCEGEVSIAVGKEGYYWSSGYNVSFTNTMGVILRKWQPWNPTIEVTLRKIVNPIAMYAKALREESLPAPDEPHGFDLTVGDWVAPHGKGVLKDIVLTYVPNTGTNIVTRYGNIMNYSYSLKVTASNEDDGFIAAPKQADSGGSSLKLDRTAPEAGYVRELHNEMYREKDTYKPTTTVDPDQHYFFRIRTEKDGEGKIKSALYGKIHGDFRFEHTGKISFTYYLNPTPNDRNLEFDPDKNLMKGISSLEEVRDP